MMKAPKILVNKDTNEVSLSEDFDFLLGDVVYDPQTLNPRRTVMFSYNVETPYDLASYTSYLNMIEVFSEKLKQDFKKFMQAENDKVQSKK